MRKGQAEHVFNDLIPAVIIILIAIFAFGKLDEPPKDTTTTLQDSLYAQEFDNIISTFLQKEVPDDLEPSDYGFSETYLVLIHEKDYTYGDLLFLYTQNEERIYASTFSEGLRTHMRGIDKTRHWDFKLTLPNGEEKFLGPAKKPSYQSYVAKHVIPAKDGKVITLEATKWLT